MADNSSHSHHQHPPSCASDDDVYSTELARRSVARASLHLGIETMSADALDALGDTLIAYLERVSYPLASIKLM